MILNTQQDFEQAVLSGKPIQAKAIFWTDEEPDFQSLYLASGALARDYYQVGDYEKDKGIFIGTIAGKQIWLNIKEAPRKMSWQSTKEYWANLPGGWHLTTLEEYYLIYVNREQINKTLRAVDGDPLRTANYWIDIETCSSEALCFNGANGLTSSYPKIQELFSRSIKAI